MRRLWLAALAGLVLVGLNTPSAVAAPAAGLAPVLLVLDGSGSMAQPAGATTKIVGARQAVRSLLAATPAQARIGLAVYGTHTGSSAAEKARGCQDVTIAHPVGPLDRTGLVRAVDAVQPRGYTPIGLALQRAARALPRSGPRAIVLVSDGLDTCAPPDPCTVARALARSGVDLRIHTVGLAVDAAARSQLLCIAQATGGSYADAPDAGSLGPVLRRTTGQALRNYRPAGRPVTGGTDEDRAPTLTAGTWLDSLGTSSRQFYAVRVPARTTAHVSATAVYSRVRSPNQSLHLRLSGPGGADCGVAGNDTGSSRTGDSAPLTASLSWRPGAAGQAAGCHDAGTYVVAVYRNSNGSDRVPLELAVDLEAPVTAAGPAPAAGPVAAAPQRGEPAQVTGGGSFGQAATLPGSGRYADDVQFGEYVFYRVRLDWGQGLAAGIRYAGGVSDHAEVATTLYAPDRERVGSVAGSYTGRPLALPAPATWPVRYRNRSGGPAAERAASRAGWYYLAVKLGRGAANGVGGAPVGVQIDLTVGGRAEPGPEYVEASAPVARPSPSPSGPTSSAATATTRPGHAVGAHRTRVPGWWPVLAGLAVAAAAALTVMIMQKRRS